MTIRFLIFIFIWCAGCALNEYYLEIESMSWVMAYGFTVGFIAHILTQKETEAGAE
jgi:hypothetical protein